MAEGETMTDHVQADIDRFPWYDVASPEVNRSGPFEAAVIVDAMRPRLVGQQLWVTRLGRLTISDIIGIVHAAEAITTDRKRVRIQVQWFEGSEREQEILESGSAHLCWYGSRKYEGEMYDEFRIDGIGLYQGGKRE